jgi:RNA recognition motif-containing protein
MASKLFVGGLPFSTTSEDLRDRFAQAGAVLSATVVTDRSTGQSRGFAFVEMSTPADAQSAITQFDGQMLGGRRIKVAAATSAPAARREPVGGRPRSGRW